MSSPPENITKWAAVSVGGDHTCGIDYETRGLHCFGQGAAGQTTPPAAVANWSQIYAGVDHTAGVEAGTGTAHYFGFDSGTESQWPGSVSRWSRLEVHTGYGCGLDADTGELHCWGSQTSGEATVPSGVSQWIDFAISNERTCGIEAGTHAVRCFGRQNQQLEESTAGERWSAVAVLSGATCGIENTTSKFRCVGPGALLLDLPSEDITALAHPVHCQPDSASFQDVLPEPNVTYLSLINALDLLAWPEEGLAGGPILEGWDELRRISLPESLVNLTGGFLHGASSIGAVDASRCTGMKVVPSYAFGTDNGTLQLVTLPNSIEIIEADAFSSWNGSYNQRLEPIQLPTSLRRLQARALQGSGVHQHLDFQQTQLQVLEAGALQGLDQLETVLLPPNLTFIGSYAFPDSPDLGALDLADTQILELIPGSLSGPSRLFNVLFPRTMERLHSDALNGSIVSWVNLQDTAITVLESHALRGVEHITQIDFPAGLSRIQQFAFPSSAPLEEVDIAHTAITTLERGALHGLHQLRTLRLPPGLNTIQAGSFPASTLLTALDLRNTEILRLPSGVFDGLTGLVSLRVPSSLQVVEAGFFRGVLGVTELDLSATQLEELPTLAFERGGRLGELSLPRTLLHIRPSAFQNQTELTTLNLAGTQLTELETGALRDLTGLTTIEFPRTLQVIQRLSLPPAPGIVSVDLSSTNVTELPDLAMDGLTEVNMFRPPPRLRRIAPTAIRSMANIFSMDLSETQLEVLESGTLVGSTASALELPTTLRRIEAGCFSSSILIQTLDLQHTSITVLLAGAMEGLRQLADLYLPLGLTTIEGGALAGTPNVNEISLIDTKLEVLKSGAFNGTTPTLSDEALRFPPTFERLEGRALGTSSKLGAVDLRGTRLTVLQPFSFAGPPSITAVFLPATLNTILPGAFAGLANTVTELDLSDTAVTGLPEGALAGLEGITTVFLPASLQQIESLPLPQVEVLDLSHTGVTTLRAGTLRRLRILSSLFLPPGLTMIEAGSLANSNLLLSLDLSGTGVTQLPEGALDGLVAMTGMQLPVGLTQIDGGAFRDCEALQSLDLSSTQLSRLQARALQGLRSLQELHLPPGLAAVEPGAFEGATGLAFVDLSNTSVTELQGQALRGLSKSINVSVSLPLQLSVVYEGAFNGSGYLREIDLSESLVSELPPGAFLGTLGLHELKLPRSVTVLPAGIFRGSECGQSLTIDAPGLVSVERGALDGLSSAVRRLVLRAPLLRSVEDGVFLDTPGLESLLIETGPSFNAGSTGATDVCPPFTGLASLASLSVQADGSLNVFGQLQDLASDGFGSCSFRSTLRSLKLRGLDLRRSVWSSGTFSGLSRLEELSVTGSAGNLSFAIGGDSFTPLQYLRFVDLSGNNIKQLPSLSRSAAGVLESLDLSHNPLGVVVENPFANMFQLATVTVDLGTTCRPGTVKQPVSVLNGDDPAVCVVCPVGHYCSDGLVKQECAEGTYNPVQMATDATACVDCPLGTTTSFAGAEREDQCVAIQLSCAPGTAGLGCNPCGPGTFSVGGNTQSCGVCGAGTVSSQEVLSTGCDACPEGQHMPVAGQALLSSCIACGAGLRSNEGSAACSGCPSGTFLDQATGLCGEPPPECSTNGTTCLPGVPDPVAEPAALSSVLELLPFPADEEETESGWGFDAVTDQFSRRLQPNPSSNQVSEGVDDELSQALLRRSAVLMSSGSARDSSRGGGGRRTQDEGGDDNGQQLQLQEAGSNDGPGGVSDVDIGALEVGAWSLSTSIVAMLVLLLAVPVFRPTMQTGLRTVDSMSMDHEPEQFAAVRRISTPTGGWCTVAALLVAVAGSSSLVLEYAYRNYSRTAGLEVAATGVPGADRAATATARILLDVLAQPAGFVSCEEALQLEVSSGSVVASTADGSGAVHASSPTLLQLTATAEKLQVRTLDATHELCWLRAYCDDCGLPQVVRLEVQAHWSSQVIGWRVAATDAEGFWASALGSATSPVADPTVANATALRGEMLDVKEETLDFVGHILDDERGDEVVQRSGFRVQDTRVGSFTTRPVGLIDPSASSTTLRLHLNRSPVFASTRVTRAFTFVQVVSSVVGLSVGIMGAFKAAFALYERRCGEHMEWLCGRTGRLLTEREAVEQRVQVGALDATTSERGLLSASSDDAKGSDRVNTGGPQLTRGLPQRLKQSRQRYNVTSNPMASRRKGGERNSGTA